MSHWGPHGTFNQNSRMPYTDHLASIITTGCQLCLTLTGGGVDHFAIFHKMDPQPMLGLGPKIPEHPEGTTYRVTL